MKAAMPPAGGGHCWRSGAAGRVGLCCFCGWPARQGAAEGSGAKGWQNHDRYGSVGAVRGHLAWFYWARAETAHL